ncbi:MAG: hypothetical protein UHN47_15795 [Lachnospiraceae bacterium]|nr:hypothetical protein [Lachnospiraceae bacterium]
MYSRKPMERNLLHRLSHINDIHRQTVLLNRNIKDARMESMSMQEVIAIYMQGAVAETVSQSKEKKRVFNQREEAERANREALAIVEVCQISNQRKEDAKERTKEKRERQRKSPGVPVGRIPGQEEEIILPQTSYDMLDVDRCAGFLLYSYNKQGIHSILGENINSGSYGGRITNGEFGRKA